MPEFFGPLSRSAILVNKKSLFLQKCHCIELLTVFRLHIYSIYIVHIVFLVLKYKLDKDTYNDLLKKNVTNDYKKTDMRVCNSPKRCIHNCEGP